MQCLLASCVRLPVSGAILREMYPPALPADDDAAPKAAVAVANVLRRRIVLGQVPVGGSLPTEDSLLAEIGVSRPTLRAALRILESEGLITVRRGSRGGSRVNAPTPGALAARAGVYLQYHDVSLDEICGAQSVIELAAIRMHAQRPDQARDLALGRLLEAEMAVVDDRTGFRSAALAFHRALVDLSGDKMLVLFAAMIHGVLEAHASARPITSPSRYRAGRPRHEEHRRLLSLIADGDVEGAVELWSEHLASTRTALLRDYGAAATVNLLAGSPPRP